MKEAPWRRHSLIEFRRFVMHRGTARPPPGPAHGQRRRARLGDRAILARELFRPIEQRAKGQSQIKRHGPPYGIWRPSGEERVMGNGETARPATGQGLRPSNREAVSLLRGSGAGSRAWEDAPCASTGPGTRTVSLSRGRRTTDFHWQGGRRGGACIGGADGFDRASCGQGSLENFVKEIRWCPASSARRIVASNQATRRMRDGEASKRDEGRAPSRHGQTMVRSH